MRLTQCVVLYLLVILVTAGCAPSRPTDYTGVVAADHHVASAAGAEMLRQGGNAVDAAVATSFCLSVVRPESCGIGGGGFMLIHLADHPTYGNLNTAIDYRESCPTTVWPQYYMGLDRDNAQTVGGTAVATPGTVKGLLYALEKYGTLDRTTVLAPAIRAAEEGFIVDEHYMTSASRTIDWFNEQPDRAYRYGSVWRQMLLGGEVRLGDRVTNPAQAAALRLIARDGADAFYGGLIGRAVVGAVRQDGGALDLADLAQYAVRETAPLVGRFRGDTILTMPPPSSGGVAILQTLGILERRLDEIDRPRPNDPTYVHLLTEAMKHAFADRAAWMADPRYVAVPTDLLLMGGYLDERAAMIDLDGALDPDAYGTRPQLVTDAGTSHLSVIDAAGNAVACTETINLHFGSKLAVEAYGFCLNNEMDDFLTEPGEANAFGLTQSNRNMPQPGKRPLSSMSPTIVLRDGEPILVAGGSGGPRIISATLQAMLNVLLFDMDAVEAVRAPRMHHQWMPDLLRLEKPLQRGRLAGDLEQRGQTIGDYPSPAAVQLVVHDEHGLSGASDPRKGGRPTGVTASGGAVTEADSDSSSVQMRFGVGIQFGL
jgi:gamma-glutamyltranspeptidase/glutathione hydrolase